MSGRSLLSERPAPQPDRVVPVREVEHCWIPVAGARLSARLWLPEMPDGASTPTILEYIPYRKRDMVRARDERNHPYLARRGYACLRVDMRGSGDSEGLMGDMYGPEEQDDAIAVIDWIARQPWCDGSVGMMGTSWGGTSSLQAAARRPEALKAIIAVCATDNRFDDDIHHMGGCLLTDTVEWGAMLMAILAAPPDPDVVGPAWRPMWRARLEALSFPLETWIAHETRDAYWRSGAVGEAPDGIDCPVLAIGGWVDRYSNSVMNLLARCQERCWGIVGPWGHHFPDVACPGPGIGFQREALRWWDRWLKGADNGVDRAPRLRAWLQDYHPPQDRIEARPGRWICEASWPSGRVAPRDYFLSGHRLRAEAGKGPERAVVPEDLTVGRAAGDSGYFGRDGGLPLDQSDDDARSLIFETDPLEEPLEILGAAGLTLHLESDRPVAVVVARLNDVPPSGPVARVVCGVRNLALDENGEAGAGADRRQSYRLAFPNTAYRFRRGHRIRLALSTSYWPQIWPAPRAARLCLHLADCRLTLPLRSGGAGESPVAFAAPAPVEGRVPDLLADPPLTRWSARYGAPGTASQGWHQPFKCQRFPEIDVTFGFETSALHRIDPEDRASAETRFEHRMVFSREGWAIEVIGKAGLTATETTYRPTGSVQVRENGALVFQRNWAPVLPRRVS